MLQLRHLRRNRLELGIEIAGDDREFFDDLSLQAKAGQNQPHSRFELLDLFCQDNPFLLIGARAPLVVFGIELAVEHLRAFDEFLQQLQMSLAIGQFGVDN